MVGASLSKAHTSGTALRTCVCMLGSTTFCEFQMSSFFVSVYFSSVLPNCSVAPQRERDWEQRQLKLSASVACETCHRRIHSGEFLQVSIVHDRQLIHSRCFPASL